MKVAVRCRPPFRDEINQWQSIVNDDTDDGIITAVLSDVQRIQLSVDSGARVREFQFDRTLGPSDSQDVVYDEVGGPIVADVLRGFNGTVLAYGQTGTGKTHTMVRSRTQRHGLVANRCIRREFCTASSMSMQVSFLVHCRTFSVCTARVPCAALADHRSR